MTSVQDAAIAKIANRSKRVLQTVSVVTGHDRQVFSDFVGKSSLTYRISLFYELGIHSQSASASTRNSSSEIRSCLRARLSRLRTVPIESSKISAISS